MANTNPRRTLSMPDALDSAMDTSEMHPLPPASATTPTKETYFERYARTAANQKRPLTQGYPAGVDQPDRGISTAQIPSLNLTPPPGQTPSQSASKAMEIDDFDTLKKEAKMKAKKAARARKVEKKRIRREFRAEQRKKNNANANVAQANAYQPSATSGAVAVQHGQKDSKAQRPARTEPKATRKARKKLEKTQRRLEKKARNDLAQIVPPREMLDEKEPASPRRKNKNVPKTLMSSFDNFSL
ncbi:hypothetical protein NpNSSI1_00001196 [Neofusicoccum parvum]|nr:hypothetical protein NpNSSI1_00001196 [Neofusicoccum parvum]